jgi:glycosyltransferase involved in cell wall biosynthesis
VATAGVDIIALSSLNEGTPVSLIEAQAAGKPIVSTQTGGIENVVIPGITALLSPVDDTLKFAKNVLKLTDNESLMAETSQKGKDFVIQRFHYTALALNMRHLYQELIERKHIKAS